MHDKSKEEVVKSCCGIVFKREIDLGICLAFLFSLLVAKCTVSWQSDRADQLETKLKYAELVTGLHDSLTKCELDIVSLAKVKFDEFNDKAEQSLITCHSELSKMTAGFRVLSTDLKFEEADRIYKELISFNDSIVTQIKEIQNSPATDFESQTQYSRNISNFIDSQDSKNVSVKSIKTLIEK